MVGDEGLPTFTDPATSAKAKGRTRRPLLWTHGGAARSNPQGGHRCDPAAFDPLLPFAGIYPNSGSKTVVPDLLVSQGANARNGCEPGKTKVWVSERFFRTDFRAALGWQFKA